MDTLLHPMIVHFPIALLVTSVLFDVAAAALKRDSLREGALSLLALGLLGGDSLLGVGRAGGGSCRAGRHCGIAH